MGGSTNQNRYDRWVVRDDTGLLHNALVYRQFDAVGDLKVFQVSTACCPAVKQYSMPSTYVGTMPKNVNHGNFLIVEWRVREAPTCLECVVAPVLE